MQFWFYFCHIFSLILLINLYIVSKHPIICLNSTNNSQFIDENSFEDILQTFNKRFVTISDCNSNQLINANNCWCLNNKTEIRRISSTRSSANETEISFDRLSVVLLTHVLQSSIGFVCRASKKVISNDLYLSKDCINSYDKYVQQLSQLIHLNKDFNESKAFQVIDPFIREILVYYVTNNTDQCFSSEDIVKEYVSYGELHDFGHELHQSDDNSSDYRDIELISQLIVRKVVLGLCIKVGESDYLSYLITQYGTGRSEKIGEEGLERLLRDLSIGNSNNLNGEHRHHDDDDDHHHHHDEHKHDHSHEHHSHDNHRQDKRSVPNIQNNTTNESKDVCLNDNFYLKMFSNEGFFSVNEVKNLCPVLLQQIVSRVCTYGSDYYGSNEHQNHAQEVPQKSKSTSKMTTTELYGYSSLAVLIISLTAILGLFILPVLSKHSYNYVMFCFIGLAFGTLAGDALLHLIPHSLGIHTHEDSGNGSDSGHSHSHKEDSHSHSRVPDYLWYQMCCLASIYGLFLFELIINAIYSEEDSEGHHGHSHSQKPDFNRNITPNITLSQSDDSPIHLTSYCGSNSTLDTSSVQTVRSTDDLTKDKPKAVILEGKSVVWGLTPLAMIVTIGDTIHNFCDGLAIGVAFTTGFASGISTSLAVLCHEIPHELGDFAVLLSTGMSVKKAAIINFVSALSAFGGLYVGILLGANQGSQQWILAICGGIFLYVALTDMLPELKQKSQSSHQFLSIVLKNIGVLLGIGCMAVIAVYEDELHFD